MRSKSPELMSEIKSISRIITCKQTIPIDYKIAEAVALPEAQHINTW